MAGKYRSEELGLGKVLCYICNQPVKIHPIGRCPFPPVAIAEKQKLGKAARGSRVVSLL